MRITSSHFKIKRKRDCSTELARFFMRLKDMLHINNAIEAEHLKNILSTAFVGIDLTEFTVFVRETMTRHSKITANKF
jgi:hypothetical protein